MSKQHSPAPLGEISLVAGAGFHVADINTAILDSNLCDQEQHLAL